LANKETLYVIFGEYTDRLVQYLHNHGCQALANHPQFRTMPVSVKTEKPDVTVEEEDAVKKPGILGTIRGIFSKSSSEKDDPEDVWSIPDDEDTEELTWNISSFAEDLPSAEAQEEPIPEPTLPVPTSREVVSQEHDFAANSEQYAPVPVTAVETGETAETLETAETESTGKPPAAFVEETVVEAEEKSRPILYATAARPEEEPVVSAEQEQDPVDTEEPAWNTNDSQTEERSEESPQEEENEQPRESPDELAEEDTGGSYQVAEIPEPKPRRTNPFFQAKKTEPPEKSNMYYMPHQLIAVWSPDGWCKSFTAFNLAALAAAKGFDTALVNYDLLCPELDIWFGVKQTGLTDRGCDDQNNMGVMTFEGFRPELMLRFLKMRAYGIQYLPAGNKLGNIGTPHGVPLEPLEQTLKAVYNRNTKGKPAITIVDAGRPFEDAPTLAALRQAAIVLIPTDGSPASAEIAKQQIEELHRLGYNPRFIEVLFATPGRKAVHICQERCSVAFDWNTYLVDRAAMKPQCLRVDGRRAWEVVLNQLTTSSGNVFRRL
jgi:hypothetical protein